MNFQKVITYPFVGLILFIGFIYSGFHYNIFFPVFMAIAFISFYHCKNGGKLTDLSSISLISIFTASVFVILVYAYKHYAPRDWDFTCFYLYGQVAAKGMNFYSPTEFAAILKTLSIPVELDNEFIQEVIDVGCPYPPPTLLLFSILGFFSYNNALLIWTILNSFFLLGSIVLIGNIFFSRKRFEGILISTILVLAFKSTFVTILLYQTLFILLFFLLLFYKYSDKALGGIFLAIAIFIKPFAAIFFLYPIIKKQKAVVLSFLISCLVISSITALVFGINPFIEYLLNNPTQREPDWVFAEDFNQSFLAILYRNMPDNHSFAKTIYFIGSGFLVLLFGGIIYNYRNYKDLHGIFFVILLSISLIIYPNGMTTNLLLHLLSLLILLKYLKNPYAAALLILFFYLVSYAGLFYSSIFVLTVCILMIYSEMPGSFFKGKGNPIKIPT